MVCETAPVCALVRNRAVNVTFVQQMRGQAVVKIFVVRFELRNCSAMACRSVSNVLGRFKLSSGLT